MKIATVDVQPEIYQGNVNLIGLRGYDEAKRYAEGITMVYPRAHGIDTRIVCSSNIFGPCMGAGDGWVVPNFIYRALNGEDITVYGDGGQTRLFCYVLDLVDGIYRLMMSDFMEPVNSGNHEEMNVVEFVRKVIEIMDSGSRIVFEGLPVDDSEVRRWILRGRGMC